MLPSPFFFYNEEGNGNKVAIAFYFHFVVTKKATVVAFCFGLAIAKKVAIMNHHLFLWFRYSEEEEDDNFCHLFQWLCCKKMVTYTFLVVLLQKR